MGPAGAGKTTIGRALAGELHWQFIEADDLHPPENIAKMQQGIGLTHIERRPWLSAVRLKIDQVVATGASAVVACSALTNDYRAFLRAGLDDVHFVYLRADVDLLKERLQTRRRHFAGPALLESQMATLEDHGTEA